MTFQEETWETFWNDAQYIFPQHWKELALDQEEIPLDLDYDRYRKLGELGLLYILSVRDDGRIVGYCVMFLMVHFHYRSSGQQAMADMYYLLPEYRRGLLGVQLFLELEKRLAAKGVKRAAIGCKVHQDHQRLFEALDWKFSDKTFTKVLN